MLLGGDKFNDSDKVTALGVDDKLEGAATIQAFGELSALKPESSQRAVWRALSACLHLGQILLDEQGGQEEEVAAVTEVIVEPIPLDAPPSTSLEAPDQRAEEWLDVFSYLTQEDTAAKLSRATKMAVVDLRISEQEASTSAVEDIDLLVGRLRRHCLSFLGLNELRRRVLDLCSISFAQSKTMVRKVHIMYKNV
jgi:hypothetical protein